MSLTLYETQGVVYKRTIPFCIHSFKNFKEISGKENPKMACHYFFCLHVPRNLELENMSHSTLLQEKQLTQQDCAVLLLLLLFYEHKLHHGNKITCRLFFNITKDVFVLNWLPINCEPGQVALPLQIIASLSVKRNGQIKQFLISLLAIT